MQIDTKQIVSISGAYQNFSRVARMTDKYGEMKYQELLDWILANEGV